MCKNLFSFNWCITLLLCCNRAIECDDIKDKRKPTGNNATIKSLTLPLTQKSSPISNNRRDWLSEVPFGPNADPIVMVFAFT